VKGQMMGISWSEYSKKTGGISIEWSSQLAMLYLKIAKQYEILSKTENTSFNTQKKMEYYNKYVQLVESIRQYFRDDGKGNLVAPYGVKADGSVWEGNVFEGGWRVVAYKNPKDKKNWALVNSYFALVAKGICPLSGINYSLEDGAMTASVDLLEKNPGGIDLSKTLVGVKASEEGGIQLDFDDPAMLQMLLNSDGLTPIIYDVTPMTPAMIDRFIGINNSLAGSSV
jgi:hypothetical protein